MYELIAGRDRCNPYESGQWSCIACQSRKLLGLFVSNTTCPLTLIKRIQYYDSARPYSKRWKLFFQTSEMPVERGASANYVIDDQKPGCKRMESEPWRNYSHFFWWRRWGCSYLTYYNLVLYFDIIPGLFVVILSPARIKTILRKISFQTSQGPSGSRHYRVDQQPTCSRSSQIPSDRADDISSDEVRET